MDAVRFVMVGGFLGSGKTTTLARLARMFQAQGRKVGIVTNDQATDLVDTHSLRSQGFNVGEVPGSCFCCNFNELTATVERLGQTERPDVVLTEPVGSCTDLVATVIRPLEQLFAQQFSVAPYGVILKPSHGERILSGRGKAGFSPKAEYIFRKQLEEADFLIVNRIDMLPADAIDELVTMLESQFPGRPVLRTSAKTGAGFPALLDFIAQTGSFGRRVLALDYDTYAEGEAELGWLNSSLVVQGDAEFSLDALLVDIIEGLGRRLASAGAETAHLKIIGLWEGFYGVANLVSSWTPAELSLPSNCRVRQADVIVNARVALDPALLEEHVRSEVQEASARRGARCTFRQTQSFRPGRPVPTHRLVQISL
ncbi:MAG TPA: GTP-binding protein [Pirellulales bacterium]|nr:GTP-binding protein [Pirellulales bacterium]